MKIKIPGKSRMQLKMLICICMSILLVSCYKTRNVNLTMKNQSSDTVWVDYNKMPGYNYGGDSCDVFIPPYTSVRLHEYDVKDHPHFYTKDWFYIYRLNIYSVLNETGVAINIDPNVANYWEFQELENETSYSIELNDTLF